jgi:hypothetical protein
MRSRSASSAIRVERDGAAHHRAEPHGAEQHAFGDGGEATGGGSGEARSAASPSAGTSATVPVCNLDGDCESCQ